MSVGHDWATCTQPLITAHAEHPAVADGPVRSSFRWTDTSGAPLPAPRPGGFVEVTVAFGSLDLGIVPLPGGGEVVQAATARVENVPDVPLDCEGPGSP
jgi:hypothetical protein